MTEQMNQNDTKGNRITHVKLIGRAELDHHLAAWQFLPTRRKSHYHSSRRALHDDECFNTLNILHTFARSSEPRAFNRYKWSGRFTLLVVIASHTR